MSILKPQDRLQPSLLERLKDDEPDKRQEPREKRVLSTRALRESVRRDLEWLLNAGKLSVKQSLKDYPRVAESVLNYGFRDLAGRTLSSARGEQLEEEVWQAITLFEPRILRQTLQVRVNVDQQSTEQNALAFEIEGELWAEPMPEHLLLKAQVDLESGAVVVGGPEGR